MEYFLRALQERLRHRVVDTEMKIEMTEHRASLTAVRNRCHYRPDQQQVTFAEFAALAVNLRLHLPARIAFR
jgi:hypothetical protein